MKTTMKKENSPFKKILVVEDIDSINYDIVKTLEDFFSHSKFQLNPTKFCDEALLKTRKSIKDEAPYDLIIVDLFFKQEDTAHQKIKDGWALIKAINTLEMSTKIIVFSVEDKQMIVENLFSEFFYSCLCK